MPKKALTDVVCKKLKPPDTGQLDVFDKGYPGLALRISYGGKRTWVYFCRPNGKLTRHVLGVYPAVGLAAARDAWRTAREHVQAGLMPPQAPEPPKALPEPKAAKPDAAAPGKDEESDNSDDPNAVKNVVAEWLRRDQAGNASYDEVKRTIDHDVLPKWKGRLITAIGKRDVLDVLDTVCDRGKVSHARHVHAYVQRLMNWCVERDILTANPIMGLPKPGETVERERALSDSEIVAFWRACKAIGYPFGPIGQGLLLTAARRSEIGELRWDELDPKDACIRLPGARTKNDEPHTIPLTPLAWRILHDGPRIRGCPFVFSKTGKTPVSGWSKMKAMLDREMRINEPWRVHDLRRTAATGLERLGVPLQHTEAVLNHVSGSKAGIVGIYQRHKYEVEKRAALSKWSGHVLQLVA